MRLIPGVKSAIASRRLFRVHKTSFATRPKIMSQESCDDPHGFKLMKSQPAPGSQLQVREPGAGTFVKKDNELLKARMNKRCSKILSFCVRS